MTQRTKPDRTVHARSADKQQEIVRYDRAGKWWVENADGTRRPVGIREAAELARTYAVSRGTVFTGRSGGSMFDRIFERQA
jgi:hypothetical protein